MAGRFYLMNPTVILSTASPVNSFDLTEQVKAVTIEDKYTELKRTTFGQTLHQTGRGLRTVTLKIDLFVDFDSQGTFEIFQNLLDTTDGEIAFDIATDQDAGAEGTFVLTQIPSFNGSVDTDNEISMTFPVIAITYKGDATPLS